MPALRAIISGTADPLKRELDAVNRMANQTGRNLERMGSGHGATSGPLRETMVLFREMGRGNFSRVPGSLSILLSQLGVMKFLFKDNVAEAKALASALEQKAAKSTAAALAAKELSDASVNGLASMRMASEGTILAVAADKEKAASAARVAQADIQKATAAREAAVAMETEGAASRFALSPVGMLAVALIAVGTAAFFTIRHVLKLKEEEEKLAAMSDLAATKLTDQAKAMRDAAQEADNYADWLRKLAMGESDWKSAIDEQLQSMRERAALQRDLAQAQGASPQQIAQMEIAATQQELDAVTVARKKIQDMLQQDLADAAAAEAALEKNTQSTSAQRQALGEKETNWKKVVDALQEKVRTSSVRGDVIGTGLEGVPIYGPDRKANANDKFEVEGLPAMSLKEALAKYNEITAEEDRLKAVQKQLADALAEKKKLTESDSSEIKRLQTEEAQLRSHLANQKAFLPKIADAKEANAIARDLGSERGKMFTGHVNSLQQIGAYAAPAVHGELEKHTRLLHQIANNTSRIGGGTRSEIYDRVIH